LKKNPIIDLRSDTVTTPTNEMWEAMRQCPFLDPIFDLDPSTTILENFISKQVGKEEAIIVSSGTMGNLIAIMAHTHPGEAIIVEANSHINESEYGGMARIAEVQNRQVKGHKGYIDPKDIECNIRISETDFCAKTTLLALENTHNLAGGTVITPVQMDSMCSIAKKYGLKVHLDGARLFNAAVALEVKASELTKNVDSVMVSLSKGLAAPIGAILAGSKEFINKAKKYKKMLGGGIHHEGIIANAGMVGLRTMMKQLKVDNKNARLLAEGLKTIDGIVIDYSGIRTNIVFFKLSTSNLNNIQLIEKLGHFNIKALPFNDNQIRMVTHKDITEENIKTVLVTIKKLILLIGKKT